MIRVARLLRGKELTLANFLDELLPLRSDRIVSCAPDLAAPDGTSLPEQRFSDLHSEVGAMCRFLVEEAGLGRGDRVAIYKTNDVHYFRWFLAVVRAGGIAVPINPLLTLPELRSIVSRCDVSTIVTDHVTFERTIGSCDSLAVRHWIQSDAEAPLDGFHRLTADWLQAPPPPPAHASPTDTVAIFHTSGTAGFPKGAMLSSQALLAGRAIGLFSAPLLALRRARALFCLPWAHIMGVSTAIYGLLAGVPAHFMSRFEAQAAIEAIERYKLSIVLGVPTMFIRLLNASPSRESLASVRLWVSASDHLPAAYRRRLLQYGGVFVNAYGMVELGGVAMFGVDSRFLPAGGELCLRVPPFRIRVVDENGQRARAGRVGECQVRGPGVTGNYWGDSQQNSSLAPGGWFRTGDLAVRNRLGLVRLVGRAKDVIKYGGYSIMPGEVEEVLHAHPAILRAAVVGIPHRDKGEEPLAVVECRSDPPPAEEELHTWCRQRLASYKLPRRIHMVEAGSLPQGVTEKVLKRVRREQYGGIAEPGTI